MKIHLVWNIEQMRCDVSPPRWSQNININNSTLFVMDTALLVTAIFITFVK